MLVYQRVRQFFLCFFVAQGFPPEPNSGADAVATATAGARGQGTRCWRWGGNISCDTPWKIDMEPNVMEIWFRYVQMICLPKMGDVCGSMLIFSGVLPSVLWSIFLRWLSRGNLYLWQGGVIPPMSVGKILDTLLYIGCSKKRGDESQVSR